MAQQVTAYRDFRAEVHKRRPDAQRALFVSQMDRLLHDAPLNARKDQRRKHIPQIAISNMNPTLATAMALALASVVCVFMWLQQARPSITSNALLVRAEVWDPATADHTQPGVIRQTIRIRTRKQTLERAIYRDAQGRRQPRLRKLAYDEEQLKKKLAATGVAWDAPLSATSYQDWHDRQRVRQDEIRRSGSHLLVLTTTTPNGPVAAQSLTVRDTDFHPIERTIAFRDSETVEIAELDYQVFPWAAVSGDVFEPIGGARADTANDLEPSVLPRLQEIFSGAQLDETELGARLVLNQLQADTGEQIQIERNGRGIKVKGLVETDQRKKELLAQLRAVPHLTASILSIEELEQSPDREPGLTSLKVASVTAQPSPLETYFVAHGRDANALRRLSQRLLSSALTVSQESTALTDLQARFASADGMTYIAKATLAELVFSHRQKLLLALHEEQGLLDEVMSTAATSKPSELSQPESATASLVEAAERNLTLCEELALGSNSQPQSAESIIQQLAASLNELSIAVHRANTGSQNTVSPNGKE
jgi:hypothetical protein